MKKNNHTIYISVKDANHLCVNVGIAMLLSLLIFSSCTAAAETKRDELNVWARNSEITKAEKVQKLVDVIQNIEEDPHYRGTAAKLAGELKIDETIELMFKILGEKVTEPEKSEFLRLECVSALGAFGSVKIYRRMMILLYSLSSWESSSCVRRFFIQSFDAVPSYKNGLTITEKQAYSVEILAEMLRTAHTKHEDKSLIYRLALALKRISGHSELTHQNIQKWDEVAVEMRKKIRND